MKHFFLIKSDLRDTNNVQRKKKEGKKSCLFRGLNPRPSVSMQLTAVLAYLSTLQSGVGHTLKQLSNCDTVYHYFF
jgi:hypothetical protein